MSYDVVDIDGNVIRLTFYCVLPVAEQDASARRIAARLGVTIREIWRIDIKERRVKLD